MICLDSRVSLLCVFSLMLLALWLIEWFTELHIETSCQLADEKEVSPRSALEECTIVVEIVASLRRECLIFMLWKLLLEPLDNRKSFKAWRISYSNQLSAGEPVVMLCNYLSLGIALKPWSWLETGINCSQVSKWAHYETQISDEKSIFKNKTDDCCYLQASIAAYENAQLQHM